MSHRRAFTFACDCFFLKKHVDPFWSLLKIHFFSCYVACDVFVMITTLIFYFSSISCGLSYICPVNSTLLCTLKQCQILTPKTSPPQIPGLALIVAVFSASPYIHCMICAHRISSTQITIQSPLSAACEFAVFLQTGYTIFKKTTKEPSTPHV